MSGKITPELRLKKLRRLEHNVICPNCGTAAPQGLGFGNVCVKFNTFICDLCKTSHQAISHRVKSITMSNWTNDEVNALTAEYGGGNEAALHIWLQNAPAFGGKYRGGSRPKEGDRIEIFKNFVSDCYDKGMFRATTPFVPNSTPQVAPVVKQSAAPAAKPTPSTASAGSVNHSGGHPVNPVRLSKPVETVDFFDTSSSTGTDPFASGGAFGDASPKPPARDAFDPFGAHSNFSSSTDLYGAGAGAGATNSTSGSVQGTAAAKPNTSTSDLLFDAFNDTPSPTPPPTTHHQNSSHNSQGFPAFPSQFPPAPGPAQASTSSGFDFIEGDPFSAPSASVSVGGAGINTFSSFDSFSSQAAVAPSHHHHHHNSHNSHHHHHHQPHHHSQNSGGASGFDFLDQGLSSADPFAAPRSAGSSITSSNMNSATNSVVNSAFASQTDLFALSTSSAAAALSAPSPVPAHSASTASAAVPPPVQVHDPFGSVFLQPTLTGGSTSSGYASGHASGHASPTPSSPYTPQSVGSVGAGSSMSGGMNGGMNGLNRSGVSPVPSMGSMGGGIGYGAHPSMGGGPSPMNMGMNMGMGMGMGMGQQAYQPMGAPVQYRASPSAPAPFAPAPYALGHAQPQRVDAIGDAFSSLNFGAANTGTRPGQPLPSSHQHQHQQASSFDFLQTTVKQQLPPTAPAGRSATTSPMGQGMSQGMNQGMNPGMGQSMGMGGYQQRPAGQYQHQSQQYPPQR